ncbi:MAG: hypothetical protein LBS31_10955 [Candidatus Adiutrix sp.]|jgi:hypothetical protein|nr:hypothetical protein [Candidatus Adiutrix sp.]
MRLPVEPEPVEGFSAKKIVAAIDEAGGQKRPGPAGKAEPEATKGTLKAENALKTIMEPLAGFPFVSGADLAAALAAVLTVLVRLCLPKVPLFGITAPEKGSGKSLLADAIALIGTGLKCTLIPYSHDAEEVRKSLFTHALKGTSVLNFDNIATTFKGDFLCALLTSTTIDDRILGASKSVTAPNVMTILATGNNLTIAGDLTTRALLILTTRALLIQIDAEMEKPEERHFEIDLTRWIPENRARLVTAGLTILRAYHLAGRPKPDWKEFGRFEDWSNLVRGALVWLDTEDPLATRRGLADADSRNREPGSGIDGLARPVRRCADNGGRGY